jgi:uncharacterized membrane-anchored protein
MFYRKFANKHYEGTILFEFEELEFIHEGKPYYADGSVTITYEAENDDFGRLDILEYDIDSVQTVSATDNDNQDIEMTAEMIKTMVKALDDTPRKQEKIHDAIVQDIDFSMRD